MTKNSGIYSASHLAKVSRKADLVPRLRELHHALTELSQEPHERPKELNVIAGQLVSERILHHNDREVRLLASCCICDVLRVYAPEAPYNEEELVKIFELFSAMLRLLGSYDVSSSLGSLALYILTSLSSVNSCVVLVYLVRNNVPSSADQLHSLFEAIITSVHANHSDSVLGHMCSVLQACIEEASGQLDTSLLEMLLIPLLPAQKQENPAAYALCQSVIHRCAVNLQAPLNAVVSQLLMDAATEQNSESSDLIADTYPLIYELHKIHHDLMLRIIPTLCLQLHTDCDVTRLKAVKLLGRLFASPAANYAEEYRASFDDYRGRFLDKSVDIRREMVECADLIVKRKPALIATMEDHLKLRLRDIDGDLRAEALKVLLGIGLQRLDSLSPATYYEMSERMKDKRVNIRSASRLGLSKIYSYYMYGPGSASIEEDQVRSRLRIVPGYVLCSFGYPDTAEKHHVVQMLQEYLLPRPLAAGNDELTILDAGLNSTQTFREETAERWEVLRASALEKIFADLSSNEKLCLQNILIFKSKVRDVICSLLNIWSAGGGSSGDTDVVITRLTSLLPPPDKRAIDWGKMLKSRDKALHRLLSTAVTPSVVSATSALCAVESQLNNKSTLKNKLESKSAVGVYVGMIYDFICSDFIVSATAVQSLHDLTVKVLLAKIMPNIFEACVLPAIVKRYSTAGAIARVTDLHQNATPLIMEDMRVLSYVAPMLVRSSTQKDQLELCSEMIDSLCNICTACIAGSGDAAHIIVKCVNAASAVPKIVALCRDAADTVITALLQERDVTSHSLNAFAWLLEVASSNSVAVAYNVIMPALHKLLAISSTSPAVAAALMRVYTSFMLAYYSPTSPQQVVSEEINKNKRKRNRPSINGGNSAFSVAETDLEEILEMLLDCLSKNGRKINMVELKSVNRNMSVDQWLTLSWCMLDENAEVKSSAVTALISLIQSHFVSSRFCVMPLLLASDDTDCDASGVPLYKLAAQAIHITAKRLWSTHKTMLKRYVDAVNNDSVTKEESDRLKNFAEDTLPECLFPYAVYLLSRHPDAPSSADLNGAGDVERMKRIQKCIAMYLDTLLDVVDEPGESIAFLLKQSELILGYYCDRRNPDDFMLGLVVKSAIQMLRARITSPLQPSQLTVPLPTDLYLRRDTPVKFEESVMQNLVSPVKPNRVKNSVNIKKHAVKKAAAAAKPKIEKTIAKAQTIAKAPTRSSSRRTSVGGKEVFYRDASEREDEEMMLEIEEAMEHQQLQSQQSSKRSRVSSSSRLSDEPIDASFSQYSSTYSATPRLSASSSQDEEWLMNSNDTISSAGKRKSTFSEKENNDQIPPTKLLHRMRKYDTSCERHQEQEAPTGIASAAKSSVSKKSKRTAVLAERKRSARVAK